MSWLNTTDDVAHGTLEKLSQGFRVDLYQHQYDFYMEYTSLKKPVTWDMAWALADGLTRQGMGCRIVAVPEERVVAVWSYLAMQGVAE